MIRFCIVLFAILIGLQQITAQQAYVPRSFIIGNDTLPYRILFPAQYNRSKQYPLVLFLHGAGERGKDNSQQLLHGSAVFADTNNRSRYPAIVVFPQCAEKQYWSVVQINQQTRPYQLYFNYSLAPTGPLAAVMQLLQCLIRKEAVDPRRIYVVGLSMGGMVTFELVHRLPRVFAAAVPICGGGDSVHYTARAHQVPFWIFHGNTDAVVGVHESRRMHKRLQQLQVPVRYTEYEGVGHNSWAPAFAEPDLLNWMFTQQRRRKARF